MEKIGNQQPLDAGTRWAFDHLVDGVKDRTLLIWYALDTQTNRPAWIIGRKINETQVLPLAILEPESMRIVKRFAPAIPGTGWDFSQTDHPLFKQP
jgi:hypothetical protein